MVRQITSAFSSTSLATFQSALLGQVHLPGDTGYNAAIAGFSLSDQPTPDLVVTVSSAADVAAAIIFAREQRLGVGVMATGHNFGYPHEGGLFINTTRMRAVTVDPEAQTIRVEAGATWGEALLAAQAHGLAPLCGSAPGVGVVGYTIHGGISWLARQFGASAHNIVGAEIVTADGAIRRIDADHEPELLWAISGGGGNFGIVTALELKLFPVPTVYGGALFFPLARAAAVLDLYAAWCVQLPETITTALLFMNFPPLPDVPEPLRGQSVVTVRACSMIPDEHGETLLAPFRALGDVLIDTFRTLPYAEIGTIANDPTTPLPAYRATVQVESLAADVRAALLAVAGPDANSPLLLTEIRHLGGALARATDAATAFGRRSAPFLVQTVGLLLGPELAGAVRGHTAAVTAALAPHTTGGIFPGWLGDGDYGTERMRAGYSAGNYARLAALKARYDPLNLFRLMHNIPPGAASDPIGV